MTADGAAAIAKTIRQFWLDKGYDVKPRVEVDAYGIHKHITMWCVRTDMVNGMPVRKTVKLAA